MEFLSLFKKTWQYLWQTVTGFLVSCVQSHMLSAPSETALAILCLE